MNNKMQRKEIIKLLKDKDGWAFPENAIFKDEVKHKSGIWFFLNNNGVTFRNENHEVVYEPNSLRYFTFNLFHVLRLKHYLISKYKIQSLKGYIYE